MSKNYFDNHISFSVAPKAGGQQIAVSPGGDTASFGAGTYTAVIIKPLDFLDKIVTGTAEAALTAVLSKVPGGGAVAKQIARTLETLIKQIVEKSGDRSILGQLTFEFNFPLLNALDPKAWQAESVLHVKWSGAPNFSKFMLDTILRSSTPGGEAAQRILDAATGPTGTGRSTFWSDARVTFNLADNNGNWGLFNPRLGLQKLVALKEGDGKVTGYNGIAVSPRYHLASGKLQVVVAGYVGVESKAGQNLPLGASRIVDKLPLGFEAGGYTYFSLDRENLYKDKDSNQYFLKKNGEFYKLWPELNGFIAAAYGKDIQQIDSGQRTATFQSLIKLNLDQIPLTKDDISRVADIARASGDVFNSFTRPDVQDLGSLLAGLSGFSGGPIVGGVTMLGALANIYQNSLERQNILAAQYENFLKSSDRSFNGFLVPALEAIAESVRVDTAAGRDTAAAAGKAITLVTDIYHYCSARAISEGKLGINEYYTGLAYAQNTRADGLSGMSFREVNPSNQKYEAIAKSLLYRGADASFHRHGGGVIEISRPGKSPLEVPFEGPQKFNIVKPIYRQAELISFASNIRQTTFDFRDMLKLKDPILWSKPISVLVDRGIDTVKLLNAIIRHRDAIMDVFGIPRGADQFHKLIDSVYGLDPRLGMTWNVLNKLFTLPVDVETGNIATSGQIGTQRWGGSGSSEKSFAFWQRFVNAKGDNLDQALGKWKKEYYDYLMQTSGGDANDPKFQKACEKIAQRQLDTNLYDAALLLKREGLTNTYFGSKLLEAAVKDPKSDVAYAERSGLGTKFDVLRQMPGGNKLLENYLKDTWTKPNSHNGFVSFGGHREEPIRNDVSLTVTDLKNQRQLQMKIQEDSKEISIFDRGALLASFKPGTTSSDISLIMSTPNSPLYQKGIFLSAPVVATASVTDQQPKLTQLSV